MDDMGMGRTKNAFLDSTQGKGHLCGSWARQATAHCKKLQKHLLRKPFSNKSLMGNIWGMMENILQSYQLP